MTLRRVRLRGTGTTELAAFGLTDAEATIEKELSRTGAGSTLRIRAIRPASDAPRIVETFEIDYDLILDLELDLDSGEHQEARQLALRAGRRAFAGTRFERVSWTRVEFEGG